MQLKDKKSLNENRIFFLSLLFIVSTRNGSSSPSILCDDVITFQLNFYLRRGAKNNSGRNWREHLEIKEFFDIFNAIF